MVTKKQPDLEGYEYAGIAMGRTKEEAEGRFREQRPTNTEHRKLKLVLKETIHSPIYPTNVYNVYWSTKTKEGKNIMWR